MQEKIDELKNKLDQIKETSVNINYCRSNRKDLSTSIKNVADTAESHWEAIIKLQSFSENLDKNVDRLTIITERNSEAIKKSNEEFNERIAGLAEVFSNTANSMNGWKREVIGGIKVAAVFITITLSLCVYVFIDLKDTVDEHNKVVGTFSSADIINRVKSLENEADTHK